MPKAFDHDAPWCALPVITRTREGWFRAIIHSPGARCYGTASTGDFGETLRIALAESIDRETLILAAATALPREQLVERSRNIVRRQMIEKRRALIEKRRVKELKQRKKKEVTPDGQTTATVTSPRQLRQPAEAAVGQADEGAH